MKMAFGIQLFNNKNSLLLRKRFFSKLSTVGRETMLSQRKAVILGYLKALGYGGLYKLDKGGLQRKLNSVMVQRKVWEPTKGNIELDTSR